MRLFRAKPIHSIPLVRLRANPRRPLGPAQGRPSSPPRRLRRNSRGITPRPPGRPGSAASIVYSTRPALPTEAIEAIDSLRQTARTSSNIELLKVCWLNRIVHGPDPLREKLTLFWHGHFATSNKKVESVALMDGQNETLRSHALGDFAALLEAIIADPAMLVWLDGGTSKKDKPNENFAREFLELFTLGAGHYTEHDIREAARAFTGWSRQDGRGYRETPRITRDAANFDDGPKTFLGQTGRFGPPDIVRIVLDRPDAATFLARKLYRFYVSEAAPPAPELIEPLAAEIKSHHFAIGPVVEFILRSRHFYSPQVYRSRVKSPVEHCCGAGAHTGAASCRVEPAGALGRLRLAGAGALRPAQRRGLDRRPALDQQRHAARANQLGFRRHLGPRRKRSGAVRSRRMGRAVQDEHR